MAAVSFDKYRSFGRMHDLILIDPRAFTFKLCFDGQFFYRKRESL